MVGHGAFLTKPTTQASNSSTEQGGGKRLVNAAKLHVDKQKIDRVESAVLLSLIGSGLGFCVFGAAVYDIGRAFSLW